MSVAELIYDMLIEIDEPELASRVRRVLDKNDDAQLPFKFAGEDGTCLVGSLHLESSGLIAEPF